MPFLNGQSLQAQAGREFAPVQELPAAVGREKAPAVGTGNAGVYQAARTRFGPALRAPAGGIDDLDPWGEQQALRQELLALRAAGAAEKQAALTAFVDLVSNGNAETIAGVYVADVFSFPVAHQPPGDAGFVSGEADRLTQFNLASQYGTVGFLAHNDLAGASFFNLALGQKVQVIFGDGSAKSYVITETHSFQAKQPNSPFSDFLDLGAESVLWSAEELFYKMYAGDERVVFQTCIAADGVSTWGRYFVIATPAP